MVSSWTEKQNKKKEFEINKALDTGGEGIDFEGKVSADVRDAAMGKGDETIFEKNFVLVNQQTTVLNCRLLHLLY